ncbi:MAG TPA: non-homologous end-joining DNA ligase [Trueperaceae bacterium]|nr:non-homologous end-joining DNA ligase [Trueperaceae bacterium]
MAKAGRADDGAVQVAGVRLTSPDRLVFPVPVVTKRDLAEYYEAVGEALLRRAVGRPLALVRCPEGVAGDCFYQKHPGESFDPDLPRVRIQEKDELDDYVYLDSVDDLVSLVQYGVVEVHAWGSTVARLEQPDRLVFDLDPAPGVPFDVTKSTAYSLRELLSRLGLTPHLRATGGKGLHVVAPLTPDAGWDETKAFAGAVAEALAAADPERLTTALPKAERGGKVFIDYLRNGRGATAIADYSVRARPGAPVALPLRWDELAALGSAAEYDLRRARRRLAALGGDPWEGYEEAAAPLSAAAAALAAVVARSEEQA